MKFSIGSFNAVHDVSAVVGQPLRNTASAGVSAAMVTGAVHPPWNVCSRFSQWPTSCDMILPGCSSAAAPGTDRRNGVLLLPKHV